MSDTSDVSRQLEKAQTQLERQSRQLELLKQDKSTFLNNISRELRTPLESILILSKLLKDNADTNLTPQQLEYADVIHSSGTDVLRLINELLSLAETSGD